MTVVVSLINLKGGVGKTTTTVQLAECLAEVHNKKVLVIDLDPQTNATIALIDEERWEELDKSNRTIYHLFKSLIDKGSTDSSHFDPKSIFYKRASNLNTRNIDLIPSSIEFIEIQDSIQEVARLTEYEVRPDEIIQKYITEYFVNYDYVLIDCPPNLGHITMNGIQVSDYFLIPTIPDRLSTWGIPQIMKRINNFKTRRLHRVECLGVVITKYQTASTIHKRTLQNMPINIQEWMKDTAFKKSKIFETYIPQSNATAEAMNHTNAYTTFKSKYGTSSSAGNPLHWYVTQLTEEFIRYAQ